MQMFVVRDGLSESELSEVQDYLADLTTRYAWVKKIYIEAEEADSEMKTNLQPFNEFKAALDHLFRLIEQTLIDQVPTAQDRLTKIKYEYRSVRSHLCRAFFDIADSCSMSIRDQIRKDLEPYSTEAIRLALPEYYPNWRPQLEKVNQKIASFRLNKGKLESEQELDLFKEYEQAINQIIVIRDAVIESACSLQDADQRIKDDASRQDQLTERFEIGRAHV